MQINYKIEDHITAVEFIDILKRSGLAERRPIDSPTIIESMVKNANLIITARDKENKIIGIARAITDFSYSCYLSCLAVDKDFQKMGIGKELVKQTLLSVGENTSLLLLSAPGTQDYYQHIGFELSHNAYIIKRGDHQRLNV